MHSIKRRVLSSGSVMVVAATCFVLEVATLLMQVHSQHKNTPPN